MIRNEEWVVNFSFFGGLDGTLGEGIGTPWLRPFQKVKKR